MSNEVATTSSPGTPARALSQQELMARILGNAKKFKRHVNTYVKFDGRSGMFLIAGANASDDPQPYTGKRILVNIFECKQAWIAWKDGKVIDTVETDLFSELPGEHTLEDHDFQGEREGWVEQFTVVFRDPDREEQFVMKLSAKSAVNEFRDFFVEYAEQMALHDIKAETPLVALGKETFTAKGNKNWKPTFELIDWVANPVEEAAPAPAPKAEAEAPAEGESAPKAAIPSSRKK